MKKSYIIPQSRVIVISPETMIAASEVNVGINKKDPYDGDGAVDTRAQRSIFDQGWYN